MEPTYVIDSDDKVIRDALIKMLTNQNMDRLELPFLFPKFLKVSQVDLRFTVSGDRQNWTKLAVTKGRLEILVYTFFYCKTG